jgi:hypothetical protein
MKGLMFAIQLWWNKDQFTHLIQPNDLSFSYVSVRLVFTFLQWHFMCVVLHEFVRFLPNDKGFSSAKVVLFHFVFLLHNFMLPATK